MEKHEIFAMNLTAIQKDHGQSLQMFADQLNMSKSTLQSVCASGNTTLDTAARIADGLGLPLDSLVGDAALPEKIRLVRSLIQSVEWFRILSPSEQEEVLNHFQRILEVMCK